jgi:hypothetical protein
VPKKSGCLRPGCVFALLLVTGACAWFWVRISLPGRLAAATHARIRLGTSMPDVLAVAEQYWDVTGSQCSGGLESFQIFTPRRTASGSLMIRRAASNGTDHQENLPFGSRPELLRILVERPELRSCRRLGFTFLVEGVPPRTSFGVEFGEDGRVARVTSPRSWD